MPKIKPAKKATTVAELLKKIEDLERRVSILESRPWYTIPCAPAQPVNPTPPWYWPYPSVTNTPLPPNNIHYC